MKYIRTLWLTVFWTVNRRILFKFLWQESVDLKTVICPSFFIGVYGLTHEYKLKGLRKKS